ncbi:hypothetical protein Pmani_030295 [Petrolisthes manimaculis]|uniref:Uncharacterized protein n=1 Tax=Petrolisthes manimaculis TaxID=1843537 RepID=A0AAE1TT05_9EUCA|nr:hypothetical protein Pmani_030295 [Petrolisthes manimaculis]
MPDLTSTTTTTTNKPTPPAVEKQRHRVTSVESKSRQVTSAIKIPKVLKSLHRKPDRLHHNHQKREVCCPECREVTSVPSGGLTQNFYLVSLLETKAARLRRHPSSRLRMWCGTCDSVAMEGCSSHSLTHLTSVLATETSTFSSTSARLSTLLQRRAGEQGEAAKGLREAVVVLDAASKSLRGQLETKLEMSTLAHVTAVSLLTEVRYGGEKEEGEKEGQGGMEGR